MRTVMAEASTVTTTTQRGPIVRRSRGPRYQARASPNNRKPRRQRQRQRRQSHFTDSIHTGCSKIAQNVVFSTQVAADLQLILFRRKCQGTFVFLDFFPSFLILSLFFLAAFNNHVTTRLITIPY